MPSGIGCAKRSGHDHALRRSRRRRRARSRRSRDRGSRCRARQLPAGAARGVDPGDPDARRRAATRSASLAARDARVPTTWWPRIIGSRRGGVRPSISSSSVWHTPQTDDLEQQVAGTRYRLRDDLERQRPHVAPQVADVAQHHRLHVSSPLRRAAQSRLAAARPRSTRSAGGSSAGAGDGRCVAARRGPELAPGVCDGDAPTREDGSDAGSRPDADGRGARWTSRRTSTSPRS